MKNFIYRTSFKKKDSENIRVFDTTLCGRYPTRTFPCSSTARIDLHSEQRNRPGLVVLSRFEQTGQLKIMGNTGTSISTS